MTDTAVPDAENHDDIEELSIEEAVAEVEDIIATLEEGDVGLGKAKNLRERAEEILTHVETELEVGDGEVNRVEHS